MCFLFNFLPIARAYQVLFHVTHDERSLKTSEQKLIARLENLPNFPNRIESNKPTFLQFNPPKNYNFSKKN